MLSSKEIEIVKSFPDIVLQTVKKHIQSLPRTEYQNIKTNFQAICDLCIAECKRRDMQIDKIMTRLQEYARSNPEPVFQPSYSNKQKTYKQYTDNKDFRKGSKSYKVFMAEKHKVISHRDADIKIKGILDNKDSFNGFAKLVGEDYAIKYQKRMIDSIISFTD